MNFIEKGASYEVRGQVEKDGRIYKDVVVGEVYLDVKELQYYFKPVWELRTSYGLTMLSKIVAFIAEKQLALKESQ